MASRWPSVLLFVTACNSAAPSPPDATPRQLDLDITVGHAGVGVFARELKVNCGGHGRLFPQPGDGVTWDDEGCLAAKCIEHITLDLPTGRTDQLDVDVTEIPDAVLEISGCGALARIPVGGMTPPQPRARAELRVDERGIDLSWSATPSARTALVWFSFAYWADLRHIVVPQYEYISTFYGDATHLESVTVQTFAGVIPVATPLGIARVWAGDFLVIQKSQFVHLVVQ